MADNYQDKKAEAEAYDDTEKKPLPDDSIQPGNEDSAQVPWLLSCRLTLTVLGMLGSICQYAMTGNISVALLCMTKNTTATTAKKSFSSAYVSYQGKLFDSYNPSSGSSAEFDWSRDIQGWILSAYCIGLCCTLFMGGFLSNRYGGRRVIGAGFSLLTILTLLTPVAARGHVGLLIAVQTLKGCASGVFVPSFYQILAKWGPPKERGFLLSVFLIGSPAGTVLGSLSAGTLCDSTFAGGWPAIFYVIGMVSAVWIVLWFLMGFSTPQEHPRISQEELKYIQASLPASVETKSPRIPWGKIYSTPAIYAAHTASICYAWSWFVSLSCFPQYLMDVLKLDIEQNALYNSLPYIANGLLSTPSSLLVSAIVGRNLLSLTWARKLSESLSLLPAAGIAVGIGYLTEDEMILAIVLLTCWVGLMAFSNAGSFTILVDMAPRFSGVTTGIGNTLNTIPGVLAPIVISAMTSNGTADEWRVVFFLCAGVSLFGWLMFTLFSSAEEQPWANPQEPSTEGLENGGFNRDIECSIEEWKEDPPPSYISQVMGDNYVNVQLENQTVTYIKDNTYNESEIISSYL